MSGPAAAAPGAEPLETFDSYEAASGRLDFWALIADDMGLSAEWRVRVEFVRLSRRAAMFGIYLRPKGA